MEIATDNIVVTRNMTWVFPPFFLLRFASRGRERVTDSLSDPLHRKKGEGKAKGEETSSPLLVQVFQCS